MHGTSMFLHMYFKYVGVVYCGIIRHSKLEHECLTESDTFTETIAEPGFLLCHSNTNDLTEFQIISKLLIKVVK